MLPDYSGMFDDFTMKVTNFVMGRQRFMRALLFPSIVSAEETDILFHTVGRAQTRLGHSGVPEFLLLSGMVLFVADTVLSGNVRLIVFCLTLAQKWGSGYGVKANSS